MSQPVRMKKRKMFVHVAQNGYRVVTGGMIVQVCPNASDEVRIGFTVTKKLGKAVIRNRIRRRLREVVRICPDIAEMSGLDFVFVGRQSTLTRPYLKLQADLAFAFNEIRTRKAEAKDVND